MIDSQTSSAIRTITVGFGIAPNQFPEEVADYTAGKEFHLTLKISGAKLQIKIIMS